MKNRISFAISILNIDDFDSDYLRDFIKDVYKLDMFYNPWYYDFHLDETYYIHLIDGNQKVFFVIPFKLSSNLIENSELVNNCYKILEQELKNFLDSNLEYNDDIALYISKDIVEMVDQDILIKYMQDYLRDFDRFAGDIISLEESEVDVLPNNDGNILSNIGVFKSLNFGCTLFDLNKDPNLNLANDPDYKDDYIFNDAITFSNWIRQLYSNKILYDFRFDETYYIHIVNGSLRKKETFTAIPFKLVNLEDEDNLILNCFNLIKMQAENSSKEQIFIYIGKEVLLEMHYTDIISQYRTALEYYKNIIECLKLDNFKS